MGISAPGAEGGGPAPGSPEEGGARSPEALLAELSAERDRRESLEAELAAVHHSKMWRAWMGYQAVRRATLSPRALASSVPRSTLRGARRLARPAVRAGSWLYLLLWTACTWLSRRPARAKDGHRSKWLAAASVAPAFGRRPRVLVVSPYPLAPPRHGGAVRIFNLIKCLSAECDIHVLVFIPTADDPAQRAALAPWVKAVHFHHWQLRPPPVDWGLRPRGAHLFDLPEVHSRVAAIVARERIDLLQLEYSSLGHYVRHYERTKVVLSEIDVAFRATARRRRERVHARHALARTLGHSIGDWMRELRFELGAARRADQVHVMSMADGDYLAQFMPDGWRRIRAIPNAVDVDDYRPPPESATRDRALLFVGNFEHVPNLDALDYFLAEVWPLVRRQAPDAELVVVGAGGQRPASLAAGREGVAVVGEVAETRPYYQRCRAMVAPIRVGSGTRLKILEALACASPVVTTTIGAEGIEGTPGEHFLVADTPAAFADAVCQVLRDDGLAARLGRAGRALAEQRYSWRRSAAATLAAYRSLIGELSGEGALSTPLPTEPVANPEMGEPTVDVSVVIPTLHGGPVLERCLTAVRGQATPRRVEVICVDSGSGEADLATMARYGARVIRIDRSQFDHGLTRDLGAAASRGRVLVFLNQDAVPRDCDWLERLIAPLFTDPGCVGVQGGILEVPDPGQRFYWHSCGDRFYFTSETRRWLERYCGLGFSTVNAAIRRDAWERYPFGKAPIMEDKKWQQAVVGAGFAIAAVNEAAVHHTHDYDLRSLLRRCRNEGIGWRLIGERYSLSDLLADLLRPGLLAELARGIVRGEVRSGAELLFPILRPLALYRGNRWGGQVRA